VRRLLALLLATTALPACFGRKPVGEFRLDRTEPAPADFPNALFQAVNIELKAGNEVELVDNGKVFDAALRDIGKAQKSIHIVTFIWSDGQVSNRVIDAIAQRTRAGVHCRVVVDALGSLQFGAVETKLKAIGCETHSFRPVPGQDDGARNHRKMIIVDGLVGITGGFGIDDKWDGDGLHDEQWRDSNIRVRGPVVLDMQQAFSENWQEVTGALLPPSAFPKAAPAGASRAAFMASTEHAVATRNERLTQVLIASAHKRVWIANAYFVPSTPILELLARKARQGVDVRILAAGEKTDTKPYLSIQRSRMEALANAGVRAYEYEPTMMHSKTILVDDTLVAVGSCNLDALSLNKMDESAVLVDDARLAQDEGRRFLEDLSRSKEIVPPRKTAGR
jgi:cardiolipin synthase